MKKQRIAFVIGCVLTGSVFLGYETRAQDPASSGQEKTCTDETIVSQLKNDGTPEFVLDGAYYTLPLEASQLIEDGWTLETETYQAEEVFLQPGERISGEFTKEEEKLKVWIVNDDSTSGKPVKEETIIEVGFSAKKDTENPDFFVTLNGIHCAMSDEALKEALADVEGYEINSAGGINISRTVDDDVLDIFKVTLLGDATGINICSDNIFEYQDYQPQEEKQKNADRQVAAYQEKTEKEIEPFANDFNGIIEGYDENLSVGFYSEGTVWGKESGEYKKIAGTPISWEVSLYIAEDTTGQLYCIANQKLNEEGVVEEALELKEGDEIRVWGYASQYLEVTEEQKLVVVQPGIVEKNGEMIILDENLKGE